MEKEITNFSKTEPVENIYSHLYDRPDSKPELGVYCNHRVEKDPTKKTALILTGFTCAGKDTVMDQLEITNNFYHVVTATSRKRREGEPEDKYVWLNVREREDGESEDEYRKRMMEEHSLVECDVHYGNVYGLPLSSLLKKGAGIPVIRPDINGARTLHRNLPKYGFQPISVALMPDSWEQIYRVLLDEREGSVEEKNRRIMEDVENVELFMKTVNYFLHNSRYESDGVTGLGRSVMGVEYILDVVQ